MTFSIPRKKNNAIIMCKMLLGVLKSLIFINIWIQIKSARILAVLPTPSISHQVVFRPLTQELARRGHEVTVITPDPAFPEGGAPANLKEINVHDISYRVAKLFQENYKVAESDLNLPEIRQQAKFMASVVHIQIQSPEVQALISDKNNKFDLIFVEELMRDALGFSHVFKTPVILISSFGATHYNHEIMGIHTHPIIYPAAFNKRTYNLTLSEKFNVIYTHYSFKYAFYLNEAEENTQLKQSFGPEIPPLSELYNNVDMLFINIHPIWADNQPVPPNVVYIGGIHKIPEKELPKDLKAYLDLSQYDIIYLSFGTNVLSGMIPPDKIQIIVEVLSSLPYNILWKWDKDELPGRSDNIKVSKWFPQTDLLRHPKVKLFITQAGLQSTDEAIDAGVPLIAIPMLADQWYNAEKYVKHGIGKTLDIHTFSEDQLRNAIESVIKDDSYRKNIIKLRELMRDQPETPLQRAVWWTEYIIRHGGAKHLRPPSANISYAQYLEIEVLFIILLTILTVLVLVVVSIVYIFNKINILIPVKKKIKSN